MSGSRYYLAMEGGMPEMWISVTQHSIDQLHEALEVEKRQRVGVEAERDRLRETLKRVRILLGSLDGRQLIATPGRVVDLDLRCSLIEVDEALAAATPPAPANEV